MAGVSVYHSVESERRIARRVACCALALRPGWRRVMLEGVRSAQ